MNLRNLTITITQRDEEIRIWKRLAKNNTAERDNKSNN